MSVSIPAHIKQKLLAAVRTEHIVLQGFSKTSPNDVHWGLGVKELWELWRRELMESVPPPTPRPNPTNYHEARDALDLFQRAVHDLRAADELPIAESSSAEATEQQAGDSANAKPAKSKGVKGKRIDERMAKTLFDDPKPFEWTVDISGVIAKLRCSKSTVNDAPTWERDQ